MNDATQQQVATYVDLPEVTFSLTTTDPVTKNEHITVVTCKPGRVLVDYLVGALTAGASRRTRFQNSLKATKTQKAKPIPAELICEWAEWTGEEKATRVVVQQRPMTREEFLAEMLKNPGEAQAMLDKAQENLDEFYEKRKAEEDAAEAAAKATAAAAAKGNKK